MTIAARSAPALALLLLVGCGDTPAPPSASSSASTQQKQASPDRDAFMMGRKYAFAGSFEMLNSAEKMAKSYREAAAFAAALGVNPPTINSSHESVAAELKQRHGERTAAAFLLGYDVTFAWCGAELGADESSSLPKIEANARAAGVPEAVWRAPLDGLEPKPSSAGVDALEKALEAHYR